jgi:hypothetical protein
MFNSRPQISREGTLKASVKDKNRVATILVMSRVKRQLPDHVRVLFPNLQLFTLLVKAVQACHILQATAADKVHSVYQNPMLSSVQNSFEGASYREQVTLQRKSPECSTRSPR